MAIDYSKYLRMDKLPLYWCPGCGNGTVLKGIIAAIDELGWKNDDIMMVSGIGCSSRATGYVDFHTIHTLHGRALPVATAIKMCHPGMHVVVVSGDGDSTAIGGNHFIHACRRNIDLTLVVVDNWIYGMTGGQYSPLTPTGTKGSTMPRGNIDPNFDIAKLAEGAGATYIARSSVAEPVILKNYIKKGLEHTGISVIDAMSNCHIQWGRRNKFGDPVKLVNHIKEVTISKTKAAKMTEEELKGKYVTGVLKDDKDKKEYTQAYKELIEKAQNE